MGFRLSSTMLLMVVFPIILALERGELLDMSYEFGDTTPSWPGNELFQLTLGYRGPAEKYPWYEGNSYSSSEHAGTHIDAPAHFSEGKLRVSDIPISRFIGPGVRVDISEKSAMNPDYQMTVKDLQDWEEINGKIPDDSLLFVYTGWGSFYLDRLAYFGSARNDTFVDDQGNSILHFPGVAPETAIWLVSNRNISGIGIDTPSIDYGQSTDFRAHQNLYQANIYGMENVANLDKLPTTGARVHALPMKIKDGSGAPVRIVAMLDEDSTSGTATMLYSALVLIVAVCCAMML
ncbi:isatin hydrolase-like [Asterias rubens]|uniref:isatin hydrolase-like n=1 Tax=Asterias rubens TaxID=7604 RepID=UPI001455BF86|nr:isatin hydrolase-like [Asterias rubens]